MVNCSAWGCANCSNKKFDCHFFSFPKNSECRKLWISRCQRQMQNGRKWKPSNHSRLCSVHFHSSAYERDPKTLELFGYMKAKPKLMDDAVPTIFKKRLYNNHDLKLPGVQRRGYRKRRTKEATKVKDMSRKRKVMLEQPMSLMMPVDQSTPGEMVNLKRRVSTTSSEEMSEWPSEVASYGGKLVADSDLSKGIVKEDFEEGFMTQLLHFWKTKQFCDLYLQFKNTSVLMHQLVLLIAQPTCMDHMTSTAKNCRMFIVPYTVQPKAIHSFLTYLYTGRLLLDEKTVEDVLIIGMFFNIQSVECFCKEFMAVVGMAGGSANRSKPDASDTKNSSTTRPEIVQGNQYSSRREYSDSVRKVSGRKQNDSSRHHFLSIDHSGSTTIQSLGDCVSNIRILPYSIHGACSDADKIPQEGFNDRDMTEEVDQKPFSIACDSGFSGNETSTLSDFQGSETNLTWSIVMAEDDSFPRDPSEEQESGDVKTGTVVEDVKPVLLPELADNSCPDALNKECREDETRAMAVDGEDVKPVLLPDGTAVLGGPPGIPQNSRTPEQPPEVAEHSAEGGVEDLKPIVLPDGSVYVVQMATTVCDVGDQDGDILNTKPVLLVGNATTSSSPEDEGMVSNRNVSFPYHKCYRCPKFFGSESEMWEHVETCHFGERFCCQYCGQSFTSRARIHAHEAQHNSKMHQHMCYTCKERFRTKPDLHNHIMEKNHFKCDVCFKVFLNSKTLKKHGQVCGRLETTVCDICHATFPDLFHLSQHIITHSSCSKNTAAEDPNLCPKYLQDRACLSASSTSSEQKRINCPKCVQTFQDMSSMRRHFMSTHTVCEIILASVTDTGDLVPRSKMTSTNANNKFACDEITSNGDGREIKVVPGVGSSAGVEHKVGPLPSPQPPPVRNKVIIKRRSVIQKKTLAKVALESLEEGTCTKEISLKDESSLSELCSPAVKLKVKDAIQRHSIKSIEPSIEPRTSSRTAEVKVTGAKKVKVTGDLEFHCPHCVMSFRFVSSLRRHSKSEHPSEASQSGVSFHKDPISTTRL